VKLGEGKLRVIVVASHPGVKQSFAGILGFSEKLPLGPVARFVRKDLNLVT